MHTEKRGDRLMKKRFIAIITITLMAVLMLGSMGMSVFANDIDYEENGVLNISTI